MSLIHFLREARKVTGLRKQEFEEMGNLLSERGAKLYSSDYYTLYFPLTEIYEGEEDVVDEGVVFNKRYSFNTSMDTPNYGRLIVSLNPVFHSYFKDVVFTNIVEPGEPILIEARAKKNVPLEELERELGWLFRISGLRG